MKIKFHTTIYFEEHGHKFEMKDDIFKIEKYPKEITMLMLADNR